MFASPQVYSPIKKPTVVSSKAYSYRGAAQSSVASDTATMSIDIGTASADRLIVVVIANQGNSVMDITSVTCAGVTLTQDAKTATANVAAIYSGLVTSGSGSQNVVLTTTNGSNLERNIFVYALTGLASNVVKHASATAGVPVMTIDVTAADFLFACEAVFGASSETFNSSTEAPANNHTAVNFACDADWTIVSSNASFNVTTGNNNINRACASYA